MGFKTELFSRPRPGAQAHYRAALALLHAMCKADRNDPGVRPADFPRLAREIGRPVKQASYSLPRKLPLPSGTPLWRRMS